MALDALLVVGIVGAGAFFIMYLIALGMARKLDKAVQLGEKHRKKLIKLVATFTLGENGGEVQSVASQSGDVSEGEDDDESSSDEKRKGGKRHHHNRRHHRAYEHDNDHHFSKIRDFHQRITALFVAGVSMVLVLYYLGLLTGVVFITRPSDSAVVDVWRHWFGLALATGLAYAVASFALRHRAITVLIISVHGSLANVLLGFALVQPIGSLMFWVHVANSLAFSLVATYFAIWSAGSRHRIAAPSGFTATLVYAYIPVSFILGLLVFMGNDAVYGWWGPVATLYINGALDLLIFALPAAAMLTRSFYRRQLALFPLTFYQEYGLEDYWKLEAHQEHLHACNAATASKV